MDSSEKADLGIYSDEVIRLKDEAERHLDSRNYQFAFKAVNEAIKLSSGYSVLYNLRALIYMDIFDYERALNDFNQAIKMAPNSPAFYQNRSTCYFLLNRFGEALADLDSAVELAPRDPFYLMR